MPRPTGPQDWNRLMLDLDPAASEVTRLLDGVTDDRLAAPTPCVGMSVAALLDHFVNLSLAFTAGARKTIESGAPPPPSAEHLPHDWRSSLPRHLGDLVNAWRDPAAWQGTTEVAGATTPAEIMGAFALDELVMHGWDLARATGQTLSCDPASTEAVLALTSSMALPENAEKRANLFGPIVAVREDASAFDRALGLAGRDPAWTLTLA